MKESALVATVLAIEKRNEEGGGAGNAPVAKVSSDERETCDVEKAGASNTQ